MSNEKIDFPNLALTLLMTSAFIWLMAIVFGWSKKEKVNDGFVRSTFVDMKVIPMPEYYRKVTGYDSIQLITTEKQGVVTTEANFCYYNQWEFEKFKKRDTVFIAK